MSEHQHSSGHGHGNGIRFETADVVARPIYLAGLALTATALAFIGVSTLAYWFLAGYEASKNPPANPLTVEYARKEPPEPRLQSDARQDLLTMRAAENEQLAKLAWVDKTKGTVQVPIERAMALLLAKGLPARSGPSPTWLPAPTGIDPYFVPPAPPAAAEEEGSEHTEAHGH